MKALKIIFCVSALIILAPIAFLIYPFMEVLNDNGK
ncbi:Uncharacterised protein [Streptococcus suis]|nr:Uncharacterised protein [Streptococcus suis]